MVDYYVSMVPFTLYLDINDIDGGLKRISKIKEAIKTGMTIGIERFKELLIKRMELELSRYGLGDSSFMNEISIIPISGGYEISVGKDYAMYVEYGTGIVGSEHPHPSPEIPWAYDINNHGDDGWQYIGKDGKLHWTKGQPSRPFMYNTWLYGTRYGNRTIEYYINRELKKVTGGGLKI